MSDTSSRAASSKAGSFRGTPRATYRIELSATLTFADAVELLDHLADVGISHLHLSPILQTPPDSSEVRAIHMQAPHVHAPYVHATADHGRVCDVLGGEDGLRQLAKAAQSRDMGLLVDVTPGFMAAGQWSPLWERLLAEGRSSDAARFFDIDFQTPLPGAQEKVILPVLDGPYGAELAAGRLGLSQTDSGVRVTYGTLSFPLNSDSVVALERAGAGTVVGKPGDARSWARMHSLMERQHYRLVSWQAGRRLVNYRRHLHVDGLAAVRVEEEGIFQATHELLLRLVTDGTLDGLVIVGIDGLADPTGYLRRLREGVGDQTYVVVDKTASAAHPLPEDWPVQGTSGREFSAMALDLQIDPVGAGPLYDLAQEFGGVPTTIDQRQMKQVMMDSHLGPDLRRLVRVMWDASQEDMGVRDIDYRTLLEAVSRVLSAMEVPRTYVDVADGTSRSLDQVKMTRAVKEARQDRSRGLIPDVVWRWLGELFTGGLRFGPAEADAVRRFELLSPAVLTLGRDVRLSRLRHDVVAACDLATSDGAAMDVPGAIRRMDAMSPTGLRASTVPGSSHGEDVGMRLAALTGVAADWALVADHILTATNPVDAGLALRMLQIATAVWPIMDQGDDPIEEVPGLSERVVSHAVGVARDAGSVTSHLQPDESAEGEIAVWTRSLLDPEGGIAPLLRPLAVRVGEGGMVASLSATLLRCTAGGVPDTVQGSERWDDYLSGDVLAADPSIVQQVSAARREWRESPPDPAELWRARRDGRIKQWVLDVALQARRDHEGVFGPKGGRRTVRTTGRWAAHLLAMQRFDVSPGGAQAIVVCPVMLGAVTGGGRFQPLGRIWADTEIELPDAVGGLPALPDGTSWTNVMTGQTVPGDTVVAAADLLSDLPVALLISSSVGDQTD